MRSARRLIDPRWAKALRYGGVSGLWGKAFSVFEARGFALGFEGFQDFGPLGPLQFGFWI